MYGYSIDPSLWRDVVYGIWEDKVQKNVPFLDPAAKTNINTSVSGAGDIEYDDDDDDFQTSSTHNEINVTPPVSNDTAVKNDDAQGQDSNDDGAKDDTIVAVDAQEKLREDEEGERLIELRRQRDANKRLSVTVVEPQEPLEDDQSSDESDAEEEPLPEEDTSEPPEPPAPVPTPVVVPTVLPLSPAELLTQRNGGGTDFKPEKIIKHDGTEYEPGSVPYVS